MLPLVVYDKVCYTEYSVYVLKWNAALKKALA